jgi:hypothetical protein
MNALEETNEINTLLYNELAEVVIVADGERWKASPKRRSAGKTQN